VFILTFQKQGCIIRVIVYNIKKAVKGKSTRTIPPSREPVVGANRQAVFSESVPELYAENITRSEMRVM
jgi:hypothetical protein